MASCNYDSFSLSWLEVFHNWSFELRLTVITDWCSKFTVQLIDNNLKNKMLCSWKFLLKKKKMFKFFSHKAVCSDKEEKAQ